MDGQGTIWRRNIAENFNRLSRAHERYRQTTDRRTDGRTTTYSERERELTFAKNRFASVGVRLRALSRIFFIDFHQHWHRRKHDQKGERVRYGSISHHPFPNFALKAPF